jgi:hypothetical protein
LFWLFSDVPTETLKTKSFKQEEKKEKISNLKSQISHMESLRRDTELSMITKADVDKLKRQLKKEEAELSRLKSNAKSQKKMRVKKKKLIKKACEEDENLAKILKSISRNQVGRPRIEEDQPQVLQTILDIVDASSAAHDRRREPIIKTVKTLDDLVAALNERGITIKRGATFLRLLPR